MVVDFIPEGVNQGAVRQPVQRRAQAIVSEEGLGTCILPFVDLQSSCASLVSLNVSDVRDTIAIRRPRRRSYPRRLVARNLNWIGSVGTHDPLFLTKAMALEGDVRPIRRH